MVDRYGDRYDSYDDEFDGFGDYADDQYGSGRSGRYSDAYSDSYSDSYSPYGSGSGASGRRLSQSSDARYDASEASRSDARRDSRYGSRGSNRFESSSNAFSDYYSNDDVETYRRSAYGSGSRRGSSAQRSSYDDSAGSNGSMRSSRRGSHVSPTPRVSASRDRAEARRQSDYAETRRQSDYADAEPAPKRSNRKRNLIIAAVVVLAVVLVGAGMAFAYINSISSNLHKGVDEDLKNALVETDMANEPFYMLLLGADTGEWRVENQAEVADTVHSDSMILARIDPVNKKATLISIDRDTMVDMGEYGEQKINAAYAIDGAAGAVKAVSKMAGLDISHYASVDFDGFEAIVDSLGGIEVDVPIAVDDPEAGGSVEAGLQTLNGEQALILCRARHAYDDMDTVGGNIRDGYQRIVISAIAKKALSSDILTIANTVREMSRFVTTDLDVSDIIGLAQIMQGIDPATDIYTAREPTESLYIDETWYELLDEDEWAKMLSRMEQGLSPSDKIEVDEATGVVLSTTGDAQAAADAVSNATSANGGKRAVNTRDPEEDEDGGDGDDDDE